MICGTNMKPKWLSPWVLLQESYSRTKTLNEAPWVLLQEGYSVTKSLNEAPWMLQREGYSHEKPE
jgi:hypothetical protein